MDSFSSSFLLSIPHQKHALTLAKPLYSSPPRFIVFSVRIEDKPQAVTSTPKPTLPSTIPRSPKTKTSRPTTGPTPEVHPKTILIKRHKTRQPPPPLPTPGPSLLSTILDALEDLINKYVDPPTKPSIDPRHVLSGNSAPVNELPPTECEIVEGILPSCLNGAYIRNGPNPQFYPRGPYHLFDGDGMLHSIRILNGKATLCSRYVKTYKYMVEHKAGTNLFPNVFSGFNCLAGIVARGVLSAVRIIVGQYSLHNGIGLANTSLAFFGNRLYALNESDLPYEIRLTPNGDIQTIGRDDFNGNLNMNMTAHPKVDLDTGETFAFRYGPMRPFLTYFRFDSEGVKHKDVPIFSMVHASFLHDFAITNKYAIFADTQIEMHPMEMIRRGGSPLGLNVEKVPRVGVIPRYASDEKDMQWFEVPGLNMIHVINAWDEVDEDGKEIIVMVAPNILSPEHTFDRMDLVYSQVEKVIINLKTGILSRQQISKKNLDFGVINPVYVGKKNRYVYAAIGNPMPKFTGVVKLDVSVAKDRQECTVASRIYGPGFYGGEPFFVASNPENPNAEEDDGYLVSYVHDENTGESRFIVMDAKSPCLDVIASVKLPQRVPYGFHGLFVRDKDLRNL